MYIHAKNAFTEQLYEKFMDLPTLEYPITSFRFVDFSVENKRTSIRPFLSLMAWNEAVTSNYLARQII